MAVVTNIAVAISTLDRPESLSRCLDALCSGDAVPAEIIIVDQSEGNETEAVIKKEPRAGIQIIYIRQRRRGLSASRNAAVLRASCPVVAITDDDCVPDKLWLKTIHRVFSSPDAPDAVTGPVLPFGPEVPGLYPVSSRTTMLRKDFCDKIEPWKIGTGGNFAVKLQCLDCIGPYDERLGAGSPGGGGEDMDLFYRLVRGRARVRYEPESLVYHERQSKDRRLASRSSYGKGIGVFCAIWMRRFDLYALHILYQWLFIHSRQLASALLRGRWLMTKEEYLLLKGTISGLVHGLLMPLAEKSHSGVRGAL